MTHLICMERRLRHNHYCRTSTQRIGSRDHSNNFLLASESNAAGSTEAIVILCRQAHCLVSAFLQDHINCKLAPANHQEFPLSLSYSAIPRTAFNCNDQQARATEMERKEASCCFSRVRNARFHCERGDLFVPVKASVTKISVATNAICRFL